MCDTVLICLSSCIGKSTTFHQASAWTDTKPQRATDAGHEEVASSSINMHANSKQLNSRKLYALIS